MDLPFEIQSQSGAIEFALALGLALVGMLVLNRLSRMDMFRFGWRKAREYLPAWAAANGLGLWNLVCLTA